MDICVLKAPPRVRSRVCAQAECSEARLVAPGADPARARRRGRRELPLPTLGSSCQLISTVTETKQGVTPRGKDAWARQILYYFTTVGPTGWCVAMPLRCGRRGSVGRAWVAHDARMTPTNENRTNEEAAPTTAFVARFAFHARAHQGQVARSAPFHDRARDAATS